MSASASASAGSGGRAGRGLLIVETLSDWLCWQPSEFGGKIVSARFELRRYGLGGEEP